MISRGSVIYTKLKSNFLPFVCLITVLSKTFTTFSFHLYFWESVKGHWTLTIASNRDHIITIAIIDFTVN